MLLPRTLSTCVTGALGVMLLAGIVSVPTTATAASTSAVVPASAAAVTIESDPHFAPGGPVRISGTGPANEWVEIDGLPADAHGSTKSFVLIDHRGVWTESGRVGDSPSYEVSVTPMHLEAFNDFSPIGPAVQQTLTADAAYTIVERELSVTDGLAVPHGTRATLSGAADAFAFIRVHFGDGIALAQADHDGRWSVQSPKAVLSDRTIRVVDMDSSESVEAELTVVQEDGGPGDGDDGAPGDGDDTDPPAYAPVEVTSDLTYLDNDKLRVSGTATPGALLRIEAKDDILNAGLGGFVVADAKSGRFDYVSSRAIGVVDKRGTLDVTIRQGGESTALEFRSLQENVEFRPVQLTSEQTYVPNTPTRITGLATPYAPLTVRIHATGPTDFVRADAEGRWELTTPKVSEYSEKVTITQFFEGQTASTFTFRQQGAAPSVAVATTSFTKGKKQLIEGTAAPMAKVDIYSGSKYLMHVTADAEGKWSYTTGAVINANTFTRTLKSEGTKDVTFTLTAAEQDQTAPITVATSTFTKGKKQLIEGTAAPKAKVDIYSGSKYLMHVTADADGKWSYTTGAVIASDTFTRTLKSEGTTDVTFTLTAK